MGDRANINIEVKAPQPAIQAIGIYLGEAYGLNPETGYELPEGMGSWADDEISLGTDVEIANWLDENHPTASYMIGQGSRYEYNGTLYLKVPSTMPGRFTAECDNDSNVILTEATVTTIDTEATDDADFRQGILKAVGITAQLEWRELLPKAPWLVQWEAMQASTQHPPVP